MAFKLVETAQKKWETLARGYKHLVYEITGVNFTDGTKQETNQEQGLRLRACTPDLTMPRIWVSTESGANIHTPMCAYFTEI